MQKLKIKQIDGIVTPAASDDWSVLTEQLATAASVNAKIDSAVSAAVGATISSVSGGTAESGKYISALAKDGTALKVTKAALPVTGVTTTNTAGTGTTTKAVVSIALSGGKVVATEKAIAFPATPHLVIDSADFSSDLTLSKVPLDTLSVVVFVNGLMQSPDDYTVTDGKVAFKNTSLYAKGDAVNMVYLSVA